MFFTKKMNALLISGVLSATGISAHAASDNTGWFVGGTIASGSTDLEFRGVKDDDTAFLFGPYAGYNFNEVFGLEAQVLTGQFDNYDTLNIIFTPRVNFSITPEIALYLRGGINLVGVVDDDNDDEAAAGIIPIVGLGARFDLTDKVKLNAGYDYSSGEVEWGNDSIYDGQNMDIDQGIASVSVYYQF